MYQRAVVWSMTASAAFFLLALRLGNPNLPPITVLYGELSVPAAWAIALVLFFLLGGYALSAIRRAEALLLALNPGTDLREAILLSASLATTANRLYRVGTVLFCPLAVFLAFAIGLRRELAGQSLGETPWLWVGLLVLCVLVLSLYVSIVVHVWRPFGSRSNEPLQPPSSASMCG